MKKKILSIIFVAAMSIGFALADGIDHGKNQGVCMNSYIWCGPGEVGHMALVCGHDGTERYLQYREFQEMLCEAF